MIFERKETNDHVQIQSSPVEVVNTPSVLVANTGSTSPSNSNQNFTEILLMTSVNGVLASHFLLCKDAGFELTQTDWSQGLSEPVKLNADPGTLVRWIIVRNTTQSSSNLNITISGYLWTWPSSGTSHHESSPGLCTEELVE